MKDGGTAFPTLNGYENYSGMSLRDWFAGQALNGILSAVTPEIAEAINANAELAGSEVDEHTASLAYHQADAMLTQREKETEK